MLFVLAFLLVAAAVFLFWKASRAQRETGLPAGRVIYSDTGAWSKVEKPFYHPGLGLTGKPDYIVKQKDVYIPVEVKSGWAPSVPYESHIYQVAAYCLLIASSTTKRPPYGIIQYRNRTFAIDFTPELENEVVDLLAEMRSQERRSVVDRSHEESARCNRCGFRSICDQRL
jgi:CRISPR-associated exonuclease Cas4